MRIAVPKEVTPGERRVALAPESVARLKKSGAEVVVEHGAGDAAGFPDAAYAEAGASLADSGAAAYAGSDVVVKVRRPLLSEVEQLKRGTTLIALLQPAANNEILDALAARGVNALSLERVPRITRAQSMDVLSSQSTVAGYKAALIGASALGKFLPMLTTAAGSIAPARVFVIGAGVAGLQAIATSRRLGAVVSAFDVRPAAREQVMSLGATFVAAELVQQGAEDRGGYAKQQSSGEQHRTMAAIAAHLPSQDLVITTAQIPGKRAPVLITGTMLKEMRPGSVIVDLAAEGGGNCELTQAGHTVHVHGVTIIGATDVPSTVPLHASQMFSKNVLTLLQHLIKDGSLTLDTADEITKGMLVVYDGMVINV